MSTFADSYVSRVLFASPAPGVRRDGSAMAPAHDLVVGSVSAGVALHAWPRSKMASEACARRRVRKLGAAQAQSSASQSRNSSRRATPMAFTQYAANMARAFMAVELAMASVNCGAPIATRAQAEKLLDEYFALVEQAVPLTEENPLDRR